MALPEFEVEHGAWNAIEIDPTAISITCPRCRKTFVAHRDEWGHVRTVEGASGRPPARPVGRPCPFCSMTAAIPEEFRTEREPVKPLQRRIVRRKRSR